MVKMNINCSFIHTLTIILLHKRFTCCFVQLLSFSHFLTSANLIFKFMNLTTILVKQKPALDNKLKQSNTPRQRLLAPVNSIRNNFNSGSTNISYIKTKSNCHLHSRPYKEHHHMNTSVKERNSMMIGTLGLDGNISYSQEATGSDATCICKKCHRPVYHSHYYYSYQIAK